MVWMERMMGKKRGTNERFFCINHRMFWRVVAETRVLYGYICELSGFTPGAGTDTISEESERLLRVEGTMC